MSFFVGLLGWLWWVEHDWCIWRGWEIVYKRFVGCLQCVAGIFSHHFKPVFYPRPRNILQCRLHLPNFRLRPCCLLSRLNRCRFRRRPGWVFLWGRRYRVWVIINPAVGSGSMSRRPLRSPASHFGRIKLQWNSVIVRGQFFVQVNSNFISLSKLSVYSVWSVRTGPRRYLEWMKRWSG